MESESCTEPAPTTDRIYPDVLSDAREACYKARDAFYACLEKESTKPHTEIASAGLLYPVECKKSRADYVHNCRFSWVKHFDKLYQTKARRLLDDDNELRRGPISFLQKPVTVKPTS